MHGSKLDLSFNKIRRIEGLGTLERLEEVYLISNKIAKMEGVVAVSPPICLC